MAGYRSKLGELTKLEIEKERYGSVCTELELRY
jgi:hypothetical protein